MRNALTAAGKTKAEHAHKQAARPSFIKFSKLIVKISNYNTIFYKIILTFANGQVVQANYGQTFAGAHAYPIRLHKKRRKSTLS